MTEIPFNAFSTSQRARLAECLQGDGVPEPIGQQTESTLSAMILPVLGCLAALIGLAVSIGWDYGRPTGDGMFQGPFWFAFYVSMCALGLYSLLAGVRALSKRSRLPWAPGTYLFATDLIDANDEVLKIYPMNQMVDFAGVHQHTNGVYQHTAFTFHFADGSSHALTLFSKSAAEQVLGDLRQQTTMLQAALDGIQDNPDARNLLFALDPLIEARLDERRPLDVVHTSPVAKPSEGVGIQPLSAPLRLAGMVAMVLGLFVAVPTFAIRNVASDLTAAEEARSAAESGWGTYEVRGYIRKGYLKVGEAQDVWLPRAEFKEATRNGSATAYRTFLAEHPDSEFAPEARELLDKVYDDAFEQFSGMAADDPRIVPFMKALVEWLRDHDQSTVDVRFRHPSSDMLAEVDKGIAEQGGAFDGIPVAPIAPSFSSLSNKTRQTSITQSLNRGFQQVFPKDVLTLTEGPPLLDEEEEPEAPTTPQVAVLYSVGTSGAVYGGDNAKRLYVGISVPFVVFMSIPGYEDTLEFVVMVEPPERFSTYSDQDASIYDTMARRAFDELASNLKASFFRGAAGGLEEVDKAMQKQIEDALGTP